MKRTTTLVTLALLAILVAACGDQGGASATATPEPDQGASDLVALLPTEVGGIAIEYESSSGAEVAGVEGITPEAEAFFDRVGAEASDLSTAYGVGIDQETGRVITVAAIRVAGADESRLREEFRASIEDQGQVVSDANVGGKDVFATGAGEAVGSGFFYVQGDVVFIVAGSPATLAEEALSQLP